MRIAIASSGLGHVARGIETWAADTAAAVAEARDDRPQTADPGEEGSPSARGGATRHIEVSLFAGGEVGGRRTADARGMVTVDGSLLTGIPVVVLRCLRRSGWLARTLARVSPGFLWRWGLKNPYGWEQLSFWLRLWPRLVRGRFDILHVQDPMVADWCRRFRKLGLVKTREILAHGTEEPVEFLARFEYVQHLAPWHLRQVKAADRRPQTADRRLQTGSARRPSTVLRAGSAPPSLGEEGGGAPELWAAIPNFVDVSVFRPAAAADERRAIRRTLGIPDDAFVIGCVAAVKKDHKRIDYLIREASGFRKDLAPNAEDQTTNTQEGNASALTAHHQRSTVHSSLFTLHCPPPPSFLLIAGAGTDETPELQGMAERLLPGRQRLLLDCPRGQMPDLYRAMDVFVLPSLFEMMPIALLEAMASGLPCLVNRHPVLEWMVGVGKGVHGAGFRVQGTGDNNPHEPRSAPASTEDGVFAGGLSIDMSREGELAAALAGLTPAWLAAHGAAARERAVKVFSKETVIGQYVGYYRRVMEDR